MNKVELRLHHWAFLAALLLAVGVWSESAYAQVRNVKPIHTSSGTYRLVFCKNACTMADSNTAIAVGYLVLSSTSIKLIKLPKKEREYFSRLYKSVGRGLEPNACFVLKERHPGVSASAAQPVGFTSWTGTQQSIEVPFFRAPDSGYTLYLKLNDNTIQGVGQFWSGNEGTVQLLPDSVVGQRVGAANPERCVNAALHGVTK
jgi:hypothetical protein